MPGDSTNKSISIKMRLKGPNTSEYEFKFQQHSSFQKITNIFCESLDLSLQDVKFYHKGCSISDSDTLMSLDIKNGDTIEVIKNVV